MNLLEEVQPLLQRARDAAQGVYDTRPGARAQSTAAQARDWFRSALASAEQNEKVKKYLTEGVRSGLFMWSRLPKKRAARFDDGWVEALDDWLERWCQALGLPRHLVLLGPARSSFGTWATPSRL